MYAIVRVSGFQYLVKEGDIVTVPHMESEPGAAIPLEVLFLRTNDKAILGNPTVPDAKVDAEVVGHIRARKITNFKFTRRSNYRRKQGHRQQLTRVKITGISAG
ncbi:MAG TPA: 50S ribosomal protein L21 [bacterium]|nr:50S ribosomal protein L21 [bacterium]